MCHVYQHIFRNVVDRHNYFRFIGLRLIRIYPLHILTLLVFVLFELIQWFLVRAELLHGITVFSDQSSLFSLAANFLLIHAWGVVDTSGWNQPSWSISVELFAYLVFPFVFFWMQKNHILRYLLIPLVSLIMLYFVQASVGSLNSVTNYAIPRGLGGFLAGMAIFYNANLESRLSIRTINILQMLAFTGIFVVMHFDVIEIMIMPFFILLILVSCADRGWVSTMCRSRPVYSLGLISYSLYMTHNIITQVFHKQWITVFPGLTFIFESAYIVVLLLFELCLILFVAYLSYKYIEIPSRQHLRRRFFPKQ